MRTHCRDCRTPLTRLDAEYFGGRCAFCAVDITAALQRGFAETDRRLARGFVLRVIEGGLGASPA